MAFSPTTFGIEITSLEQRQQARPRVLVIAVAVALAASIVAAHFLMVSPNTVHALWTGDLRDLTQQHWLDAGVGAVLLWPVEYGISLIGLWVPYVFWRSP